MTTNVTSSTAAALLKTLYMKDRVELLMYRDHPFLAMVAKAEDFGGDGLKIPVMYATPQNMSASISAALAGTSSTASKAFVLTQVQQFGASNVSNFAYEQSRHQGEAAFVNLLTTEVDNCLKALGRKLSIQIWRTTTGTVGTIGSGVTTSTVTIANPDQIVAIEVGQSIAVAATDGGAVRAGTAYVVAVDRVAGTFQCSATQGGAAAAFDTLITSPAAGDFIYIAADDRNAAMAGVAAWVPVGSGRATALAASFYGVVRTADATRLGGLYLSATSGQTIEEALIGMWAILRREGSRADKCFMCFGDYARLVKELQGRVMFTDEIVRSGEAEIGFRGVQIHGGAITVIPDSDVPPGYAFLLDLDSWKLHSMGPAARLFEADGLQIIRDASADQLNFRVFFYGNLACRAPGFNGALAIPS